MKKYTRDDLVWNADLGNGNYQNPIIFADYSDPDVIRVDDTYYLTASSFNYTPGLPILTSQDLVNWQLVNYATDNIPYERYRTPRHSEGVWAPAIRYHDGWFYIYYGMPDEGIFMVRTQDPLGKWEDPVCVLEGKGLIDSCPFWDEDGKAYIIHGYARSRIGFKSILGIFEMTPDGRSAISEDHFIFNGNDPSHPALTIEGPKVYKRNGYYYIWAPAGGVKTGYQVVLRSRDIHGPYEIKTVMHQGNTQVNGPHQGGLVDTRSGEEWFIHFQDMGLYGRVCHLQPVKWVNDWPIVGIDPDENNCGEPALTYQMPDTKVVSEPAYLIPDDDFENGHYSLAWQWLGNHDSSFVCDSEGADLLRLRAMNLTDEEEPTIWKSANVLTQKIICPEFETIIEADLSGLLEGDSAGCVMMGGQYALLKCERGTDKAYVMYSESVGDDDDKREFIKFEEPISLEDLSKVVFKMTFEKDENMETPALSMSISLGGREFEDVGCSFTPSDHTWVGAKTGIFALSKNKAGGSADFISYRTDALVDEI